MSVEKGMDPIIKTVTLPLKATLNPLEVKVVQAVGKLRRANDREAGLVDRLVDEKQDRWEVDMDGFGAELALCKMLGVYPDLDTTPRKGGIDCILRNGQTVDVKSTKAENGRLIAPVSKGRLKGDDLADIAILVITNRKPTYYAVGWLPMAMLLDKNNIVPFGPKRVPTHVVERNMLNTELQVVATPHWEHRDYLSRLGEEDLG